LKDLSIVDHLLNVALIGTGKQSVSPELTDQPADQLVSQCSIDSVERSVLLRAGVWSVCQSAGVIPQNLADLPEPAVADVCPPCPPRACEILVDLLNRKQHDLLTEAFQLLVQFGQRIPPAILPQVLETCDPAKFESLLPAISNRGRWLGQFNETWNNSLGQVTASSAPDGKEMSLPTEVEQVWNEGTLSERKAALSRMRGIDSDRGRKWLESIWSQEKANTRAELLEALAVGIGSGDISFFEQALGDSSKRVRAVAAQFLCRFDDSRLAQRMRALAECMLAYTPTGSQGRLKSLVRSLTGAKSNPGKLSISLPSEFDKQWERDGIQEKPPSGTGQREFWLVQIIERVPPTHWEEHFQISTDYLVRAAQDDDFGLVLLEAWSKATLFFNCSQWMAALWDFWNQWKPKNELARDRERAETWIKELLKSMPEAERQPRIHSLLERSFRELNTALCPVEILQRPWPSVFARQYLSYMKEMAASPPKNQDAFVWTRTLTVVAAQEIPQQSFGEALAPWVLPEGNDYATCVWRKAVDEFQETVTLRNDFYQTVTSTK
jgi:hypothetical protein